MTEAPSCRACGGKLERDDVYCPACGTHRPDEELAAQQTMGATRLFVPRSGEAAASIAQCPSCRAPHHTDALFCTQCGHSLKPEPADAWTDVRRQLEQATAGEFEIVSELGRGGMAAVYVAKDLSLGRNVAIKVMAPGLLMGEGMVARFRQEAVTIANLRHPNIITVHGVRQAGNLHFFIMQLVEGGSLDAVLKGTGPLAIALVQAILYQVGTGLAHAHAHGVVHRDIKPANVLLDGEGNAIVTDFGIAKAASAVHLTQTGSTLGTPSYMSPEQCLARELSGASDQYSLGIVAYEMLVGRPPFTGSPFEIMQAHTMGAVGPFRDLRPDCPPELEAAVLHMLARDPAERFPTVAEAIEAVGGYLPGPRDPLRLELARLVRPDAPAPPPGWKGLTPIPSQHPTPLPAAAVATPAGGTAAVATRPRRKLLLPLAVGLPVLVTLGVVAAIALKGRGQATPETPGAAAATAPLPARLSFAHPAESLAIGAPVRVRALLEDSTGQALSGQAVSWSSRDVGIATVAGTDQEAWITGVGAGVTTIDASAGGATGSFQVVVSPPVAGPTLAAPAAEAPVAEGRVQSVAVNPPASPLEPGRTVVLRSDVTARPPAYRGDTGLSWSSSAPDVAAVTAAAGDSATVALLREGEAILTAAVGGARGSVTLRVRAPAPATSVSLAPTAIALDLVEGAAVSADGTVRVTVTGGVDPFLGIVSYEGGARDWLRTSLAAAGQGASLTVRADGTGLTPGNYLARLPVGAGPARQELTVRLTVSAKPVSTAVEPSAAAQREIGDMLSAYAAAVTARNETRVRQLYPSIPATAIRDLMRIQSSDIFQVQPLPGTLRAGRAERTLDIDVSAGIVPASGAGQTRRMTYTVGRSGSNWVILGVRTGG